VSKRDDLFAAVYGEPDSDDPRIVLADYLMGEGDPRGQFIAKQLAGDEEAAEQLLAKHGPEWLGSLRPFTNRVQFRRGFPTRLELVGDIDLAALAADPALGTIEDLLIGDAHHAVYGALIASPTMTALRRIEITHPEVLIALGDSPARITHVGHAVWAERAQMHDAKSLDALLKICEGRGVTSLAFDQRLTDDVVESSLFPHLTSITLAVRKWLGTVHQRRPDLAMQFVASPRLEPCIAGPERTLGAVELVREGDRIVLRGWGEWVDAMLGYRFDYLPKEVVRIEVHGSPQSDWLERIARTFEIEIVVLPERPRHGYVGELAIRARSDP
jgi:uncharacterized protein (TIGR02996 family)